jgi:hypothetical protein
MLFRCPKADVRDRLLWVESGRSLSQSWTSRDLPRVSLTQLRQSAFCESAR